MLTIRPTNSNLKCLPNSNNTYIRNKSLYTNACEGFVKAKDGKQPIIVKQLSRTGACMLCYGADYRSATKTEQVYRQQYGTGMTTEQNQISGYWGWRANECKGHVRGVQDNRALGYGYVYTTVYIFQNHPLKGNIYMYVPPLHTHIHNVL